jgi:hypothetical protein
MKTHLQRLEIAPTIPENFGRMKAIVYADALAVLEAFLDLVRVQLVYLKTPAERIGSASFSLFLAKFSRSCHQKFNCRHAEAIPGCCRKA